MARSTLNEIKGSVNKNKDLINDAEKRLDEIDLKIKKINKIMIVTAAGAITAILGLYIPLLFL